MNRRRARALVAGLAVASAACSSATDARPASPATGATVAIGARPEPIADLDATVPTPPTTTTIPPPEVGIPLGDHLAGNRILLIGDEVLASGSERRRDTICPALVPAGWDVEVEAEPGRDLEFAERVLDTPGVVDADAVVIMLGHRLADTAGAYSKELDRLIGMLAPRPVVLVTLAGHSSEADLASVNRAILARGDDHRQVLVLDWASFVAANEGLIGGDGHRLTAAGSAALGAQLAAVLGEPPAGSTGVCRPSVFTDDSAVVL